jgi:hypothetical protein
MTALEQVQYSVLYSATTDRQPRYIATNCSEQTVALYRGWIVCSYYYVLYYYLTAIGLTPGGSSTVHIYTQTVHRIQRTEHT